MASIRKRTKANGEVVYDCSIVMKKYGVIIHRESKTFKKRTLARNWGLRRELELQEKDVYKRSEYLSVGSVIEQYLDMFPANGRTKNSDLHKLLTRKIAKCNVHQLTAKDLIGHIKERNQECLPQTANNDLIWLNMVIKTMARIINLDTDLTVFTSAREVLRQEGLIARPDERDRRPTKNELWRLSREFYKKKTPYLHIMYFAIYSARRLSEICKIRWDDIDHDNKTILVRDMKTPGKKVLNLKAKLPKSAYKIIMRQPRTSDRIFPYNPKTISTVFTNTCKMLDIKDLHFHDLRRHACSLLAENGLSIEQIAHVSLHQTWSSLQVYHKTDPGDLDI